MDDQLLLWLATGLGHLIGAGFLWWVNRVRKSNAGRAAQMEALAAAFASAIEREKDQARASGDADDASVVKSITSTIARDAVQGGLEGVLTSFLAKNGLNVERKLGPLLALAGGKP